MPMAFWYLLLGLLGPGLLVSSLFLEENTPTIYRIGANTTLKLEANGTGLDRAFWVFEAHSQYFNLTLDADPGTGNISDPRQSDHVGWVAAQDTNGTAVYLHNIHQFEVPAILLLRGYTGAAPVPGACQGQMGAPVARPGIRVVYNQALIEVSLPTAGLFNASQPGCNSSRQDRDFEYTLYHRYLNERNFGEDYFLSEMAETMLTLGDIRTYGRRIDPIFVSYPDGEGRVRMLLAAYPGTPSIVAAVVTHLGNQSAVYVSAASYACEMDIHLPHNCRNIAVWFTQLLNAGMFFAGLFIAFFGHRYFTATQFIFGFFIGGFIGYIVVQNVITVQYWGLLGLCLLFSLAIGGCSMLVWLLIGIPVIAVILPLLTLGSIVACIVLFFPPMNATLLMNDTNYWLIFCGIALLPSLPLIPGAKFASLLTTAVLGSALILLPFGQYFGSTLKYIFFNVLRRASVKDFKQAFLCPPYQTTDIALTVSWIAVMVISVLFQYLRERDRSPFPPSSYHLWQWSREENNRARRQQYGSMDSERTPLINGDEEFQEMMRNNISQVQSQIATAIAELAARRREAVEVEEDSDPSESTRPSNVLNLVEFQTSGDASDLEVSAQRGPTSPRSVQGERSPRPLGPSSSSARSRGGLSAGPASLSTRSSRVNIEPAPERPDPFKPSTPEGFPA